MTTRFLTALLLAGTITAGVRAQPAVPPAPSKPATGEPSPQDVMKSLENDAMKKAPAPPVAAPSGTPSSGAGTVSVGPGGTPGTSVGPGAKLLREGSFLASRRGRMVRSSEGAWLFVFDSDSSTKAEPPMTMMPCLNLQAMEKLAERGGDALSYTVSGQVFVYKNRNYLLPTLYVINRRAEMTPGG